MSGDQISLLPEPTEAQAAVAPKPGRTRRTDPPTSTRAAANIGVKAGALKHRILQHLAARGALGANDWELHVHCDPHGRVHSAATRRKTLEEAGYVRRTAITRPTDDEANEGLVHVITEAGAGALATLEAVDAA